MSLPADEFLRRFLLHLLPRGFVRIRNFGFLANRQRAKLLPLCFSHVRGRAVLLNSIAPSVPSKAATGRRRMNKQLQPRTHSMQQHARPGLRLKLSTLEATAQAYSSDGHPRQLRHRLAPLSTLSTSAQRPTARPLDIPNPIQLP
jgi:hypothetical protein